MRLSRLALLLAPVMIAPALHADTFQFSFQGDYQPPVIPGFNPLGGGPTLAFSLQLTGPPVYFLYDQQFPAYEYVNVSSTGDFASPPDLILDPHDIGFYTVGDGLYDVYGIANIATTDPFYTGPDSDPVYHPGIYQAEFEYRDYSIYDGTLAITDLSTVTPEPATFALLGTGLVGVTGLLRRRRRSI